MTKAVELQGHRGARGLRPENTLPSFEVAIDVGVTSIETDVHLTRDGVPIVIHDPHISKRLCRELTGQPSLNLPSNPLVSSLSLEQIRGVAADQNPDVRVFTDQSVQPTPLAQAYASRSGIDLFTPPTLEDLITFLSAYAGEPGRIAGKTPDQQARARYLRLDLELKRVPFRPELIGDTFDGVAPGLLETRVVEIVRAAGMLGQVSVRSFDHRSVRAVRRIEPGISGAVLIDSAAPVDINELARKADATVYCPAYQFLDAQLVRQAHEGGVRVIPWTVNNPHNWAQLLDWGVDGITTDYPDRLAKFLAAPSFAS